MMKMMNNIFNKLALLSTAILLIACSTEDDLVEDWIEVNEPEIPAVPSSGSVDVSNYISIGNSLTAGFMDGALYNQSQENSFPNLLAGQFALVGGGSFSQPDINSENGFNSLASDPASGIIRGHFILDTSTPGPAPLCDGELITAYTGDKTKLGNFGVPGMRLGDLETAGYGFPDVGNPYFTRFASDPSTASVLGDALAVDRSFFSLWLGANDYLGYALSGGQLPEPLSQYSGVAFGADLGSALTQLTAGGTEGVVLDLPPVVTLPYFQAVSWDAIALDEETAEQLNSGLSSVNAAIQGITQLPGDLGPMGNYPPYEGDISGRLISYSAGNNPILVHDPAIDDFTSYFDDLETLGQINAAQRQALVPYEQCRPLTSSDLVLLAAGTLLGTEAIEGSESPTTFGVVIPLGFSFSAPANGDQYFLDVAEQTAIVTARATYNGAIAQTVAALNGAGADIALVSVQPLFVDLLGLDAATATSLALPTESADGVQGVEVDGAVLAPDFSPNGVFSTDGVHPNPRGHAIVANAIIGAINERWNASIPEISVLEKLGVEFSSSAPNCE